MSDLTKKDPAEIEAEINRILDAEKREIELKKSKAKQNDNN